jgi:hypothetical protein
MSIWTGAIVNTTSLLSCNLLDTARSEIFDKTAKDMHEDNFFFSPNNTERICRFLKRTRLGFSKGINWDYKLSDKGQNEDIDMDESSDREEDKDLPWRIFE